MAKQIIKFGQILVHSTTLKSSQLYHNFDIFLNCPIVYNLGEIMDAFWQTKNIIFDYLNDITNTFSKLCR